MTGVQEGVPGTPTLRLADPPPDDLEAARHGGLKLDWRSEVGRHGQLLEWWPVGRDRDAGVPLPIVRTLARGLAQATTVVGCTLDVPATVTGEWTPVPGGHARRFARRSWVGVGRLPLGLLATRDADAVARLFDDDAFAWSSENQLLLLAPPDTLPRVDRALVEACFARPIATAARRLAEAGVVGLVVAGVDPLARVLAESAAAAGVHWEHEGPSVYGSGQASAAQPG